MLMPGPDCSLNGAECDLRSSSLNWFTTVCSCLMPAGIPKMLSIGLCKDVRK